jgi:hypothetical protein
MHEVPREHPRLFGPRSRLQALAKERPEAYARTAAVARNVKAEIQPRMASLALVCAIEQDAALGREAVRLAMTFITGEIKQGHIPFAYDLGFCAFVYDLCHEHWTPEERARFHEYVNRTVDANVDSELHVFHNGWYGYKHWGYGVAAYATYYENPRAPKILADLVEDYRRRAAPALTFSGAGGGFGEGYYVNYWIYEWLVFCEVARTCEGVDHYAAAPEFYRRRAVASMFEMYPGFSERNARRPVPMGDGGGRTYHPHFDRVLSSRRILASFYRDDPGHQAVHAYNELTPRAGTEDHAYMDFLWRDTTVKKGDLKRFRLSHLSHAAGYVHARSSWDEDATYLFFHCGRRFTAHQHLDIGHFLVWKHAELAGDGGHYDDFDKEHAVNYYVRTIAHSTMLVHDPDEVWKVVRKGPVTGNDGGQTHDWPHHNGGVVDIEDWKKNRELYEIGALLAFEDQGAYVYLAGDCTRAYSPRKLECFTRQIVFLRPDTIVIFDRVKSRNPAFKKTWLLQALKPAEHRPPHLVVTHGDGRLFIQTLLPEMAQVRLVTGPELYAYGGRSYPPKAEKGPAPECRVEVSPAEPSAADCFLHVLTAAGAKTASAPIAVAAREADRVVASVGRAKLAFATANVGGSIELDGRRRDFASQPPVHPPEP